MMNAIEYRGGGALSVPYEFSRRGGGIELQEDRNKTSATQPMHPKSIEPDGVAPAMYLLCDRIMPNARELSPDVSKIIG
jgi:hypothetical protein